MNNYKKWPKPGQNYLIERGDRFPLDPESVVNTYSELLNDILKGSQHTYPGQLVSFADDITLNHDENDKENRDKQGLYIILNTTPGGTTFAAHRLAMSSEVDEKGAAEKAQDNAYTFINSVIEKQTNPIVLYLNGLYAQGAFDEVTESSGIAPDVPITGIIQKQLSDEALYVIYPVSQ